MCYNTRHSKDRKRKVKVRQSDEDEEFGLKEGMKYHHMEGG